MIRGHLGAILWLKLRLSLNQLRRRSALGTALTIVLVIVMALTAVVTFVVPLILGVMLLPKARPVDLLFMWDVIAVIFLFFWIIGVVTELQRSEPLSLDKLLHLPISLRGAFLLNYAGSLLTFSLIAFVPAMFALSIALVAVFGPRMLIVFPLVVSFLLMVTAITYQFRGWLAAMMANKRRRGTIVAVVTLTFIGLTQLPQLFFWLQRNESDVTRPRLLELDRQAEAGTIDDEELKAMRAAVWEDIRLEQQSQEQQSVQTLILVNRYLPPGWLPYGTRAAAQGHLLPGALGSLGAFALAGISLALSYRTTMRLYTARGRTRRRRSKKAKPEATTDPARARPAFLERTLPGCPEQATAVALANYRSLTRSPQAKLLLMTPIILLMLFGSMLVISRKNEPPEQLPPLMAVGAIALAMFCLIQLMQNMFGFDRDGFRGLVLSAAPRHEILLGKNISVAPLAFAVGGIGLAALQFAFPLRVSHLLASVLQLASVYMICCMVGNIISIVAPMAMSTTTLKPAHPKFSTMLKQMVFAFLFPIAMLPTLIPLGIELLLDAFDRRSWIPVYLSLSVVELLLVILLYRRVLRAEGRFLQHRERRILDEVTRAA